MKGRFIRFATITLAGILSACGGDGDAENSNPNADLPRLVLAAPEYAISGRVYELSAQLEGEGVTLAEGHWESRTAEGNFVRFSLPTDVTPKRSLQLQKIHMTSDEALELRFVGKDSAGASHNKSVLVPIYEEPLHVGAALTVKAGREITLQMALNEQFQRDIAGEFDDLLWQQISGSDLNIENATTSAARFIAPDVDAIKRFEFLAKAKATQSGMTFEAKKVVFVVPESEWVDAVAIHNTDGPKAVLRQDSSLLMLGNYDSSSVPKLVNFDFEVEMVKDLGGSLARVVATFNDHTAKILYSRLESEMGESDPFAGVNDVQSVEGTRYGDARDFLFYLSTANDVWLVETGDVNDIFHLKDQNIQQILPGLGRTRWTLNDELIDANEIVIVTGVQHVAGTSGSVAYLTLDGTFGHTKRPVPAKFFAASDEYERLESNSNDCELVFGLRKNGDVDAFTPSARPLPPDVSNVKSIKSGCSAPMALRQDGTVVIWHGVYGSEDDVLNEIIVGEKPAPWNLVNPI